MKKKAIIFDLDGTLLDSVQAHYIKHKDICKTIANIDLTKEYFVKHCSGTAPEEFYPRVLKERNKNPELAQKAIKLHHHYNETDKMYEHLQLFPQVLEMLEEANKKFNLALATSAPLEYLDKVLKKFPLKKYFSVILSAQQVQHSKPAPDIFLRAQQELGYQKEECVVVEDSVQGTLAAQHAGIDCITLTTSQPVKELPKYANIINEHIQIIPSIIQLEEK